jgi:DNA-binding GntR family transcriptional regulator
MTMADVPALQMTVAARVADQLRAEIRQGALDAGMPLRQNEIASRLGVSSTPVREAFQILERMGLVVREGRRGVRVFRPSMQDLVNGYEVRGALESMAARMAALRLSEPELAAIADTMRVMHAPRVSQKTFLQLNAQFHAQIGTASGNARLAELIVAEQSSTTSFVAFLGVDASSAREAHGEHAAIVAAIAARDADAAGEAMLAHLATRVSALQARLGARGRAHVRK